ncbi:16S rRNA (guanine1207-N2)-methyltransferase [Allopseudospirillum japonicum]|uniref:16S rRNA (Guanine1207-N2)-methyltransferase n=1 Tax=Allopseudospirillum japonicum TaxID=64971 RepID=A0A1H6U241_9GAMM|nr:methyltransferase [Allopseudospirillum japonicum]SEI85556.1 16S rRNA (guanine1207-N2)-methyltransferase [Allopseudospirillum japonicum]
MSIAAPSSQLLAKYAELFAPYALWVTGAPIADPWLLQWQAQAQKMHLWCQDWRVYQQWQQAGLADNVHFAATPPPALTANAGVLYWPKAREEGEYYLSLMARYLPKDAPLFIVGDNKGGINPAMKRLTAEGINLHKVASARRCSLYQITQGLAQLATQAPQETWSSWLYQNLHIHSLAGVFAHGHLDAGTELLLTTLAEHPKLEALRRGRKYRTFKGKEVDLGPLKVLDVGCGTGIISAALKQHQPLLEVSATDVSALALAASERTFAANQLDIQLYPADMYQGLPKQRFDLIVSNPPFHTGRSTDYQPALTLIEQAPAWLDAEGQILLVANRFLPWETALNQVCAQVTTLAHNAQFNVYLGRGIRRS